MSAAKRVRSRSPEVASAEEAERSEPWFEDGNIILHAPPRIFRVYRGYLASCSPVFKNLFSIGTPQGDEVIDGCPVVRLTDDADHVAHALKALFQVEGSHLTITNTPQEGVPLSVLAAFLQFGRKYDIQRMYDRAMSLLTATLPTTVDGWQARADAESTAIVEYEGLAMDLVNLVRQHDLLRFLPAAHLSCLRFSANEISDGVQRSDGSMARLSSQDQRAHMIGREALHSLRMERGIAWVRANPPDMLCLNPHRCNLVKKGALHSEMDTTQFPLVNRILAMFHDSEESRKKKEANLCNGCYRSAMQCKATSRAGTWNELPALFGLESWEAILPRADVSRT